VFCRVGEPRKLSDLQSTWELVQRRSAQLVAGTEKEVRAWWQKAPQSAPDFRASVFMVVGQGRSESDWKKYAYCSLYVTWIHV